MKRSVQIGLPWSAACRDSLKLLPVHRRRRDTWHRKLLSELHGFQYGAALLPHFSEKRIAIFATMQVKYGWHDRTPSFDRLFTTCLAMQG